MTATHSAPIRIPEQNEVLAVVRSQADLVEAFRKMKAILGMTNAHCDELANMGEGATDKYLGPTCSKEIGALTFNRFCWLFGVQFEMRIDLDQMRVMAEHWEDRKRLRPAQWSETNKVSKKLINKARPHVYRQSGRSGGLKRAASLPAKLRSRIARKAGKSRMKKATKEERSLMARKGWETRRARMAAIAAAEALAATLLSAPPLDSSALECLLPNAASTVATLQPA